MLCLVPKMLEARDKMPRATSFLSQCRVGLSPKFYNLSQVSQLPDLHLRYVHLRESRNEDLFP